MPVRLFSIQIAIRNSAELVRDRGERINHIGIEVAAPAFENERGRLIMRKCGLINTTTAQGVVDIRHRHKAAGDWNGVTRQLSWVATAIPLFLMGQGNFLGTGEEFDFHPKGCFGVLYR